MNDYQKMAQNTINLASQATRVLTIRDWLPQDCEEFLEDMEKEFRKVKKALDTYSPQECEAAVKKMSECRLWLEAARFEAEKVVTRLLKDHEAWGHVSREARQPERRRMLSQSHRRQGEPSLTWRLISRSDSEANPEVKESLPRWKSARADLGPPRAPEEAAHHQHAHWFGQGAVIEGGIRRNIYHQLIQFHCVLQDE